MKNRVVTSCSRKTESAEQKAKAAGENLKKDQVKRAISLSAEKYCSASIMLSNGGVVVTHDFTVIESSNKKN